MSATRYFLQSWLPPIIWAAVIFAVSGDQASGERTSRFVLPLLQRLLPSLTAQQYEVILLATRKVGHLAEYAVLAFLTWRALRARTKIQPTQAPFHPAGLTFMLCMLYAITDEVHQAFVPSRIGSPFDVAIDAAGAWIGLLIARFWRR